MNTVKAVPYGAWKSPIAAELVATQGKQLSELSLDGNDVYWIESRPSDGGRQVIVRLRHGQTADLLGAPFNARSGVHEYGGGAYTVSDSVICFSNFSDQRLYRLVPGEQPIPLTSPAALRFADGVIDQHRQRLISVAEDHALPHKPRNSLMEIDLRGLRAPRELVAGDDFYAAPRLSPDGKRLAWLSWNHPDMPWDATELWIAGIAADGSLGRRTRVAGDGTESIMQPLFSPSGELYFVSDRSGWWNIYRWSEGYIAPTVTTNAEFAMPHWVFRQSTYAFESSERIVCAFIVDGRSHLGVVDTKELTLRVLRLPFVEVSSVAARPSEAWFIGSSPNAAPAIVRVNLVNDAHEVVHASASICLPPEFISRPQSLVFPTSGGEAAHGFYYPPTNPDVEAPPEERPPLLVCTHGGPTSMAPCALNLKLQYWTSRGLAVLDVNYRGSSGFGRDYRNRLHGQWGVMDVADCIAGTRYLIERGWVDGARLAIRGGSAGGYTTLCALAFANVFKAGASYYGVSDLERLAADTHKFEAHYLDRLVGPYPDSQALYRQRSPIHHADRVSCPVIFFQGSQDKVVPPDQTERMVQALRRRGIPVAYVVFDGEQHGFRRSDNIQRALEAELYFYGRFFGFAPADAVMPIAIE